MAVGLSKVWALAQAFRAFARRQISGELLEIFLQRLLQKLRGRRIKTAGFTNKLFPTLRQGRIDLELGGPGRCLAATANVAKENDHFGMSIFLERLQTAVVALRVSSG